MAGNRLVEDYVRGEDALAPFFAGHPFHPEAYRRKAEEVRERFGADALAAMTEAVRPMGDEAERKLERVAAGEGFVVTTGQQPGLFGGPLYTIHKTLTAIALADRLESLLAVPVLPLFWVASDDHDWEEANHVSVLDMGNALRTLTLEGDNDPARSMGRRALAGDAESALRGLAEALPPSEFTPPLLEQLRAAYAEGSVADAFTRTMAAIFEGMPLGIVDAQDATVRRQGLPVLRRELESAESHERALREQSERLEAAGYPAQVTILPGATNVFHEDDEHGRERILRQDGSWQLRASGRTLDDDELREALDRNPERFSANVVLRPVVESAVFPTLAYVGGPGEVSYLAQTGCLFEAHGVGMPVVFPRLGVTLVETKVRKVLDKLGLEEEDLLGRPVHEVISGVVRDDVPDEVQTALSELRQAIQDRYQAVYDAAESIDPTLKGPIFGARNEGFKAVADVEKKIRQHVKMKGETELDQVEKIATNLAPGGKPQERVLNVHQYLARYGNELIPSILDRMEIELDATGDGWTGVRCD